jgi:DNA-directed RNA polymerase specialized sigma24 family protein
MIFEGKTERSRTLRNRWPVADAVVNTPIERALADGLVSATDLLRLKAIARLHAWGLPPDMSWSDLLQEALLRVLQGSRRRPADVSIVAFLAGVMRSIKAEQWRRRRREYHAPGGVDPRGMSSDIAAEDAAEPGDPAPNPEQRLALFQELAAIYRLFSDDPAALQILNGLASGLTPDEIRDTSRMTKTEYDSTRKRMRRALLRAAFAWRPR